MRIPICALVILLAACAHREPTPEAKPELKKLPPPPTAGASIEAKELAAEEQAPFVTEFRFHKGKSALTKEDDARLAKFVEEARKRGEIQDVKVISWADMEYPSVHTKRLARSQVRLAADRANEIEARLHEREPKLKVEKLNMAERPNAFGEWLGTVNARIKKELEVAGIPNTDTSVKTPSKASHAIVLFTMRERKP